MKLDLRKRLAAFFQSVIPTRRVTVFDPRAQLTGVASSATVESVHAAMEMADSGHPRELFALYQEIVIGHSHLQGEFAKRKLAVLGDAFSVTAAKKDDAAGVAAADFLERNFAKCKGWDAAMIHLLDAALWPVAVVEKVFAPTAGGFRLAELVPVPDALLAFETGTLRIRQTTPDGMPLTETVEASENRYIIHRGHLLSVPDHRGGPLRSLVWWWLLSTMDREWWVRFLDRYGAPFLVGKFQDGDDASRSILERAFSYATKIGGLVVSRETDVEIQQAMTGAAGDAYEKFLTVCNREISKLIVGQTLSGDTQAQGFGNGASGLHSEVRDDIRQFDARQLASTLRRQLVEQLMRINGMTGDVAVTWGSDVVSSSAAPTGALLGSLAQAGIELSDEGIVALSTVLGLPLQRAAAPPRLMGARSHLLSADRDIPADLAREFSGALAPIRAAIHNAADMAELEHTLSALYSDWPAKRVAKLMSRASRAFLEIK